MVGVGEGDGGAAGGATGGGSWRMPLGDRQACPCWVIREGCGKGRSISGCCCPPFPSCFVGKMVVTMVMVVEVVLEYYFFEIGVVTGRCI